MIPILGTTITERLSGEIPSITLFIILICIQIVIMIISLSVKVINEQDIKLG